MIKLCATIANFVMLLGPCLLGGKNYPQHLFGASGPGQSSPVVSSAWFALLLMPAWKSRHHVFIDPPCSSYLVVNIIDVNTDVIRLYKHTFFSELLSQVIILIDMSKPRIIPLALLQYLGRLIYPTLPASFRGDTINRWILLSGAFATGRKHSTQGVNV